MSSEERVREGEEPVDRSAAGEGRDACRSEVLSNAANVVLPVQTAWFSMTCYIPITSDAHLQALAESRRQTFDCVFIV